MLAWCAPPCVHMCIYAAQGEGACVRESYSALCSVLRRIPSLRGCIGSHRLPPGLGLNRRREAVTERGLCIYWQRGMFLSRHAIMLRTIMQGRLAADAFAAVCPLYSSSFTPNPSPNLSFGSRRLGYLGRGAWRRWCACHVPSCRSRAWAPAYGCGVLGLGAFGI